MILAGRDTLTRQEEEHILQLEEQRMVDAETPTNPTQMIFLGGYVLDAELAVGTTYELRFLKDRLVVCPVTSLQRLATVLYRDMEDVEIGGPEVIKSGGGFTEGKTVLRLQAIAAELFFLNTATGPEQLRIQLSRSLEAIRQSRMAGEKSGYRTSERAASAVEELGRLVELLESGLMTREEYDMVNAQIIARVLDNTNLSSCGPRPTP